ncbi:proton-conducting transporter membrane subunit [Bdellovibrionota bacterium FG-1]
MSALICILIPLFGALLTLLDPKLKRSIRVLLLVAIIDVILAMVSVEAWRNKGTEHLGFNYFIIDSTSRLFLLLITFIFLGISLYIYGRVVMRPIVAKNIHSFIRLTLVFFSASILAVLSNHLILMWVFIEATTLSATPLIYHRKGPPAFRAAWKYLLFSTLGLGLTFLGFLCLAKGMEFHPGTETVTYFISELTLRPSLTPGLWQHLGIALVLFGFGTKLGMAPMYAWLPETYDEAPPSVTALLAAIQFNCAVLALFRIIQIYRPFEQPIISAVLTTMGLASIVIAALNIVVITNYKRLIAYASINHAGVIAIGLGLGKSASYGVILYILSNALVKALLFLTCGNIKARFHTKIIADLHGLIKDMPYSGWFLMVGIFALLGFAPFGSFFGEIMIMNTMIEQKAWVLFIAFCALITVIFVATGRSVFPMIWGEPTSGGTLERETLYAVLPKLFFVAILVSLGIYLPASANTFLQAVALTLSGGRV